MPGPGLRLLTAVLTLAVVPHDVLSQARVGGAAPAALEQL